MTIDDILQHYGSQTAAAKAIGVTQGLIWQWARSRRNIPIAHQIAFEVHSSGALKADLPPEIRSPERAA